MSGPAKSRATYEDVLAAPPNMVAEVIAGELHLQPRPTPRHAHAATGLWEELGPPFRRGRGGPGGWVFLDEPELHLGDEPQIVVPDLAGWRRERLPELPDTPYFTLAPDWLCEVLSPSTQARDRSLKMPLYCCEGGGHVWLVDPTAQTLEVYRLDGETYRLVVTRAGDCSGRFEPFDAISLDLNALWKP